MQKYQITEADLEAGMGGVYQPTVQSGMPSRPSSVWKIVGAIFFIALCFVASAWFAWHFLSHTQGENTAALHSTTEHQRSSAQGPVHPQQLAQSVNNIKAAIHLHVSVEGQSLQWVNDVDQSFEMGGLKLENNEIVIPSDGLYFIYSQASFQVPCKSSEEGEVLSYAIHWFSPAAPSEHRRYLLNGVKSACQPNTEEDEGSNELVYDVIYLGAVFKLYKGDKLSTEASHTAYIDDQSAKTFFGVFQM